SFGEDLDELFATMQQAGAPARWMDAAEVHDSFPAFGDPGPAVYESGSGVLAADRCLQALTAGLPRSIRAETAVEQIVESEGSVADGRRRRRRGGCGRVCRFRDPNARPRPGCAPDLRDAGTRRVLPAAHRLARRDSGFHRARAACRVRSADYRARPLQGRVAPC